MFLLAKPSQILRDVLNGRMLVDEETLARRPWLRGIERAAHALHAWLFGRSRSLPPEEGDAHGPDAGRPAPLQPRPGHHLVAANALPPSDRTYLLPKD